MDINDLNNLNKVQLDEILKAMNDWADNEIKTKGYILESEIRERFIEESGQRRFIENEMKKPWKRPNDEG